MMTDCEREILGVLTELDGAVKQMAAAKTKPDLVALFTRIEALTRRLPPGSDPELLHFLHKKSYEKARVLLESKSVRQAAGGCS